MIKVEQLHNVMMDYNGDVLWIKYSDDTGLTITSLTKDNVLDGDAELDVLRFIIKALSIVETADTSDITDKTNKTNTDGECEWQWQHK